jgi:integrase/recombinase XerD
VRGVNHRWRKEIKRCLSSYINDLNNKITEKKTLDYLLKLKKSHSNNFYRKKGLQIRRFLLFNNIDWANRLKFPKDTLPIPKRVDNDDILNALEYFKGFKEEIYLQCTSIIHLVSSSGIRPFELFRLQKYDIDFEKRTIKINRTKTGNARIVFFNKRAKEYLLKFIDFFEQGCTLLYLFSEKTIERRFRHSPIRVKDLRKYFSQELDRRGGPTSIKKILMGHSLKGDVDLMHYNAQSENDLKKIYDKIMSGS